MTRVQWQVLLIWNPLWAVMDWVHGLQISRNEWWYIGPATIGRTWVGHITTVAILNDSYSQTRQQVQAFFVTLLLAYIWAAVNTLLYSQQEDQHVVCTCNESAR